MAVNGTSAETTARAAKLAFDASQLLDPSEKNRALTAVKGALHAAKAAILEANARDVEVRSAPS